MAKYSRKATNQRLPSAEILPQGQNDIKTIAAGGIEDNIYHNLKGLDEIKFSNEALGFDPSDVVARASRGRNKIFEKNLRAWVDLPTDKTPRRQKANAIANCFNRIQSLTARVRNKAARREWSLLSSKPYKAAQRFAGFAVVDKPSRAPQAIPGEGLQKAHAVLDLSYDDNSPLEDSLNRLAKAALDMFHCQPDRRFVIGISVVGSSALLTVFNRSGMFLSDTFNINHQPERFVRLVMGVVFVDRAGLGYDPTVHITRFEGLRGGFVKVNKVSYNIIGIIHASRAIVGRGTLCLKVKRLGKIFVVKNSWQESQYARGEIDALSRLGEVRGVPELVDYEILRSEVGLEDDTAVDIDALVGKGLLNARRTSAILNRLEPVQQVRLITTPFGVPLSDFKSQPELLNALICVVDAIEALNARGIVHRDISDNNVLLSEEVNENGDRNGILIDFDLSAFSEGVTGCGGTFQFAALDVLHGDCNEFRHQYYHDLESVFYLLCYVLCQRDVPLPFDLLHEWVEDSDPNVDSERDYISKWNTVKDDESFGDILRRFNPKHNNLKGVARKLRNLIFPSDLPSPEHTNSSRDHHEIPMERLPVENRQPKEYFTVYRRILVEAYDSLRGCPETELDGESNGRANSDSSLLVGPPSEGGTIATVTDPASPVLGLKRSRQSDEFEATSRPKRLRRNTLRDRNE